MPPVVIPVLLAFFFQFAAAEAEAPERSAICSAVLRDFTYDLPGGCPSAAGVGDFSFWVLESSVYPLNCSKLGHASGKLRLARQLQQSVRFSDGTCRNLSRFGQCLRGCNSTSTALPFLLLPDSLCGSANRYRPRPCATQTSVDAAANRFLKSGVRIEWERNEEPYVSDTQKCDTEIGNYSSSAAFLCFRLRSDGSNLQSEPPGGGSGSGTNRGALLTSLLVFASLLLVAALAVAVVRGKWLRLRSAAAEEDPTALFLNRHRSSALLPPVFTYEELEYSTNRFDPKRKIGDGGFGSVYLGQLFDGRIVAVKKLHRRDTTKPFSNEVLILSSIDHPSLVKLHGYCCDRRGLLLVYDYVPNGTLADHLHGPKNRYPKTSLTWAVRLEMALQIATAVEYLHFSLVPAVVHRDITSTNIFVEKDMRVRVGDFGLSRLLVYTDSSAACVWTGPQGTPGYLDPDYHRSFQLTEKSDVYSFGVVLCELISGMKAVDLSREKREMALADLVVGKIQSGRLEEVLDPVLAAEGESIVPAVHAVAELAFRCVAADKDDRPDAREAVAQLKRIRTRPRSL